ncbi:amidohydrolase family protein [Sphingomonas sp. BN140010]|uniref:Amidohydrolase family protein n=1 Tax=Sphingomonas arvum TaxID=2992113 RepID=A0ABT3JER0_9SPHN|nr:amidohydrolase family protein [Sphingomonas sp. BN140010]MCW3797558.1 amidohydrolase family protein [Sphingomonas sp. BN140010]
MIRSVLLGALLVGTAVPVSAETIAIVRGTVAIGDGSEPIQNGTVVIRDGRVVGAGAGVAVPAGARVIDATGKWVTPGIVAGFSRLGLSDVDAVEQATDTSSEGPFSAALDIAPAINPNGQPVAINRADGVTRAIVAPSVGKSIFAGQGALIDTGADLDAVTRPRLFQFIELGETGSEQAGGSRAAAHVLLRNALREAAELGRALPVGASRSDEASMDQRERPVVRNPNESRDYRGNRSQDVLLTRFDAAALVPVLQGRQLLMIHAERASDLLQVIALGREFPRLRLVIVGADEGWTVADRLAQSGIPVIASALSDLPANFESIAATQSNVGRMRAAGVKVAIGTINDDDTRMAFRARYYAGNLVALAKVPGAAGLSWGEALAMVTSRPAEAVGLGGEIGSLQAGRRGDVVIWSSDPLDNASAAETVLIDGVEQPLATRQTRLRQRYQDLSPGVLPQAYRQ